VSFIVLHDQMNPDQEVALDLGAITAIAPFGSGATVECGGALYSVRETVAQVERLMEAAA
jgi:hypothetical protein